MATRRLSASRIKCLQECSQKYWAQYHLKVPEIGNTGSQKGSTVHDLLEILLKQKRHKKHVEEVVANKTCKNTPAIWKLLRKIAARYHVDEESELKTMDKFILVALNNEFYGPENTKTTEVEKVFEIKVEEQDKNYYIKGFIDKIFIAEDKQGLFVRIRDYKSSKAKFGKEELLENIQSRIYQLAIKKLYPDISRIEFDFLFLKFPKEPIQKVETLGDQELSGFEYFLTFVQEQADNFEEKNAKDNLAVFDKERAWLCGKEGLKKDGSKAWICSFRKPLEYYILLDKEGQIVQSAFYEKELKPKNGQTVQKKFYTGCPYYFNDSGQRRKLQFAIE